MKWSSIEIWTPVSVTVVTLTFTSDMHTCQGYHGNPNLNGLRSSHFSVHSCRHVGAVHGRHAVRGVAGWLSNCVCVCVGVERRGIDDKFILEGR